MWVRVPPAHHLRWTFVGHDPNEGHLDELAQPAPIARLVGFDGLRAVAALSIFAYHFSINVVFWSSSYELFDVLNQLRVGVWVFFVVSGFLLYRPYVAALRKAAGGPRLGTYARHRFLRLFPAYFVALVLLTYVFHKTHSQDFSSFLTQLGLLQIYVRSELLLGIDVTWSLATEVSFYIFLPCYAALIAVLSRGKRVLAVETGGLLFLVIVGLVWQIVSNGHVLQSTWLPSFLPVFAAGMTLAVIKEHAPANMRGLCSFVERHGLLCWGTAAALLIVKGLTAPTIGFEHGFAIGPQTIFTAVALLVVAPCALATPEARTVRVLDWRPLQLVGVVSYGLFLWHVSIIRWVQLEWIPSENPMFARNLVVFVVSLVVTLAVATASWMAVERPMLRLAHRR